MEAIGIYTDGKLLRLAHVKKSRKQLKLLAVESVVLPESLEINDTEDAGGREGKIGKHDPFGVKNEISDDGSVEFERKNNLEYIIELLQKYPVNKVKIGLNLPESSVHFVQFTNNSALKGKKLRQKMIEDSNQYEGSEEEYTDCDDLHYVKIDDNNYLIQNFSDNIPLLENIIDVKPLIDNKLSVSLITPSEVALSHLEGLQEASDTGRKSLIVYITNKIARILFLENNVLSKISPVINIESGSNDLLEVVFAKALLMLDELGITAPDSIFLAGENADEKTLEFIGEKFPDVRCGFLTSTSALDLALLDNDQIREASSFAIPIGLAAGMINKDSRTYENTNFLPMELKKEQRKLRVAWHGYAALFMLFIAGLFFTYQWYTYSIRINEAEFSLLLTEDALKTEKEISEKMIEMENITGKYKQSISLIDSLWKPGPIYSETLFYLSNASRKVNSMWINRLIMRKDFMHVYGSSMYRNRIHRFADAAGTAVIKNMESENVRKSKLYNFELMGDPQDFIEPFSLDGNVSNKRKIKNSLVFKREK
ncbi:MAG: hypothetical protein GY863_06900 [bacterium]|nr:hypothetical protein [bacterium]